MGAWVVLGVLVAAGPARADYMDHFVVREDVGPRKAPSLGEARLLLIPVEVKGFPPLDRAALERFFSPQDPQGFVAYYEAASLGRYRPRVTVAPTVRYETCPLPAAAFPGCRIARGDITALTSGMEMMRDVVRRTRDAGFSFAPFDVNGRRGTPDGWVDGVMLLANVPLGGIAFPFGYFNQEDDLSGGTGGPLVVDGLKLGHFAIAGDGDVHVMVHEFGHLLGLTDLYDESGRYDGLHLSFMGAWYYDPNIPLPDAETRLRLRWATWHQVQGRQRVVVRPAGTTGDVYRLGTGDEYLLVENRGPGAFDRQLPQAGLAVFHVDRRVKLKGGEGAFVERILDCVNCDPWHPYIRLVQADGRFDVERGAPFAAVEDLFLDGDALGPDPSQVPLSAAHPVSSTNLYSGAPSGLRVEEVRVLPDGSIEATLEAPEAGQCAERLCADGEGCAPVTCGAPPPEPKGCAAAPGAVLWWAAAALLLLEQRVHRRQKRRLAGP